MKIFLPNYLYTHFENYINSAQVIHFTVDLLKTEDFYWFVVDGIKKVCFHSKSFTILATPCAYTYRPNGASYSIAM